LGLPRIIGRYTRNIQGPLFIVIGGIHGNEPAGIDALQRVFKNLHANKPDFAGMVLGVSGNVRALELGERFIDMDLNRQWKAGNIERIEQTVLADLTQTEEREQKQLLTLFKYIISHTEHAPVIMMDLHSTSSTGGCFTFPLSDELSRDLALFLEQPVINGLENMMSGTTLNYFSDMKYAGFAFEAGQHVDPITADRMEAAVWFTMERLNQIKRIDEPRRDVFLKLLRSESEGLPKEVRLQYRHAIESADGFIMNPGYKNFQKIEAGEVLARDRNGDVLANQNGLILMPLYQKKGEDGFFIVSY